MLAKLFEKHKLRILSEVESILSELGEEKVRELIKNDVSLWHVWQNKQKVISDLEPYYYMMKLMDVDELSRLGIRLLQQNDSRFNFIPRQWLSDSLAHAQREIQLAIKTGRMC